MATTSIVASAGHEAVGYDLSYATARSTAAYDYSTSMHAGQYIVGGYYVVRRGFLKFDTSSLAGNTITQVNLSLTVHTNNSTVDFDVQIVKQDWSAYDPIGAGNRDAAFDACLAGTADSNIWRNTSGIAINTPYSSGNLDTSWVNTAGTTYYSLRSNEDYDNSAPSTSYEFVRFYLPDAATEAYRPTLIVEYTEGGGGSSTPIHLIRTGMQPGMRIGL